MSINGKIIIVDDDENSLLMMAELLSDCGLNILQFTDPVQALEALPNLQVTAVVSDIDMPIMNGIVFAQNIRKRDWKVPIIFLSGYEMLVYEKDIVQLGYTKIIEKPLKDINAFIELLHVAIRECMA